MTDQAGFSAIWRAAIALGLLVFGVVVELSVLPRLPLPGAGADLVVLIIVGLALAWGPESGAVVGFAGGLLLDLAPPADHPVGLWAAALCLVGFGSGLLARRVRRSRTLGWLLGAVAAVAATTFYAGLSRIFGDDRVSPAAYVQVLPTVALYSLVAAPLVVTGVRAIARRLAPEAGQGELA